MFFSPKSRKERKIKKYLEEISETIDELKDYQQLLTISRGISKHIKEDEELLKQVMNSDYPDDDDLINSVRTKNKDLLKTLKKIPTGITKDEWEIFKEHIDAENKRLPLEKRENVAFAGGGAKGMAHVGAIRSFAEHGLDVKSVSGTSAGAITALPYALGYAPRTIENIVYNYDFTSFIYESVLHRNPFLNKVMGFINPEIKGLMHRSVYLETFREHFEEPFFDHLIKSEKLKDIGLNVDQKLVDDFGYDNVMNKVKKIFSDEDSISLSSRKQLYKEVDGALLDIVREAQKHARESFMKSVRKEDPSITNKEMDELLSQEFKTERDAIRSFFRMHRNEDVIEEFFGDLIENKLMTLGKKKLEAVEKGLSKPSRLRDIDFVTFQKVVDAYPEKNMKSLAVCVCEKLSDNPLQLLSKDNYQQIDVSAENPDPEMRHMPIKTAVRMSMNLPGAYSSYEYKGRKYVDGGVRANFPLHYFDKNLGKPREETLGLCLAPEDKLRRTKDVSNIGDPSEENVIAEENPIRAFFKKVKNSFSRGIAHIRGNKLDNNEEFDQTDLTRIGIINVKEVETTNFGISQEQKHELFKEGYKTTNSLLSKSYNAQETHLEARIEALHSYVYEALKEKDLFENVNKTHGHLIEKIRDHLHEQQTEPEREYNIKGRVNRIKSR